MEDLIFKRTNIFNEMKDAKINNDFETYLKHQMEYKRITAKIYHYKNKDNTEYKTRKNINLKKYLENPENYEKHIKAVKTRNRNIYNSGELPARANQQPNSKI